MDFRPSSVNYACWFHLKNVHSHQLIKFRLHYVVWYLSPMTGHAALLGLPRASQFNPKCITAA